MYKVMQDGADFYLHNADNSELEAVITYPQGVKDFDLVQAEKARRWFIQLMLKWDISGVFEDGDWFGK